MSDASTVRMIERYMDEAEAPMFLSSFLRTPPRNFHSSEFVEIDIMRDDEDVAIAVHDVTTGARLNEANQYTNKRFKPPVFKEAGAVSAWSAFKRQPGSNPFEDVDFAQASTDEAFGIGRRLERKIRRAVEKMTSDMFQTGVITLTDASGNAIYSLDYQQKDSHRVDAATAWSDAANAAPLTDLESLSDTLRKHGHMNPDTVVMGTSALQNFLATTQVRNQLDNRRINRSEVERPSRDREGAAYHGTIIVGNRTLELWLYDGFFRDPVTETLATYIGDDNALVLSSRARLDMSYGAVPYFRPEARAMQYLPTLIQSAEQGLSLSMNSYITQDNSALRVEVASRPLPIPTAIDTFGVINTAP